MKDARGHGSNHRGGGTARGQVYRDAVANVQRAMGTWAQGIIDAQAKVAPLTGNMAGHGPVSIADAHGIPTTHLK
jgi:hypothetical protein